LTLLAQNGAAWVYERARSLPIARLVYETEIIPDDQAAIERIHQPDFDPVTTAILAAEPACEMGGAPDTLGTVEILAHEPTYWRIETNNESPALLILAENTYPGWQVTVDGRATEALTAYTTLRAVCIPAGRHMVEWRYIPTIYWIGGGVTVLSLLIAGMAIGYYWRRERPRADGLHELRS
jgi:hypothetical protein